MPTMRIVGIFFDRDFALGASYQPSSIGERVFRYSSKSAATSGWRSANSTVAFR